MQLSVDQRAALNRDNRQFNALDPTGTYTFADLVQDILDDQESTTAGITANAQVINALANTGAVAVWDQNTTSGSTLNFAWLAFRLYNGKANAVISAGSIALSASNTNYVEVDRAGTVSKNTTGFTSGRKPLFTVVTGVATYAASNVVSVQAPDVLIGDDGVDGSMLSVAAQTKEVAVTLGLIATAAGATTFRATVPTSVAAGSKITKARFVTRDALAASDTNYITFGLVNKQTGAGAQTLVDNTAAANSTKVTGGSALAADTGRDLTLVALSVGTERDVTGGHTLVFTATVTGTLANTLRECYLLLEFTFDN